MASTDNVQDTGSHEDPASSGDQEQSGVFMACLFQANRLGVAFYDSGTCELSVMQSHDDGSPGPMGHQMLQLAKLHASPEVIYTTSKADATFIARLQQPVDALEQAEGSACDVRLKKSSLFHPRAALSCLQHLHVAGMPAGLSPSERLHMLGSMINMASMQQLGALGALLSILHQDGLLNGSAEEDGLDMGMSVNKLSEMALDGMLMIDAASLSALQIFQQEHHPSVMGVGQSKEGLSVFGMLNKCVTIMGRRLLQLWFKRPIINLEVVRERQAAIEMFMTCHDTTKAVRDILAKVKDVPKILQRLRLNQGMAAKDLGLLTESLANLMLLKHAMLSHDLLQHGQVSSAQIGSLANGHMLLKSRSGSGMSNGSEQALPAIVHKAFACISDELQTLSKRALRPGHALITSVIDADQEDGMLIAQGVSDQLDEMKMTYAGLPSLLTHVVERELERIPRSLRAGLAEGQQMWSILYMPQVGFVTRLEGQRLTADLQDYLPDYEFAFEGQGDEVGGMYYYSDTTRELNAEMGDMLHKIRDFEGTLCTELLRRVAAHGPSLLQAVSVAAEIDCLIALAISAVDFRFTRPVLTTKNELRIKGGRHMLMELVVDTCIPNDTIMAADAGRVQVITGPNFSGKSCYIKQVGIIVLLAHIGSFVPAEEAIVGVTDRIFTRIISVDAHAIPQSTFMTDLCQVSAMLRNATSQSLCLIDEFGKGTLSNDGVGLLCATLGHFVRARTPPKVIACTHYSEVLNERFLPRHPMLSFHTMNVLVENDGNEAEQSISDIVFLYRLVNGYAAPSFGLHCAQLAGLRPDLVQRARQVIQLQERNVPIPSLDMPMQAQREKRYRLLLQQLCRLNTHDAPAVQQFLRRIETSARTSSAA